MKITAGDEYFYHIPGLTLSKRSVSETLETDINLFVDEIQGIADALTDMLDTGRLFVFSIIMEKLCEMLGRIGAMWLEAEGEDALRAAKQGNRPLCEELLSPFINNILTLSIDIQIAQLSGQNSRNRLEHSITASKNLNAILKFIRLFEMKKALYIASNLPELGNIPQGEDLMKYLSRENKEEAETIASDICENYAKNLYPAAGSLPRKIMAVDDKPEILTSLSRMLKESYQVLALTSGAAALKALEKQKPEVFVLDIEMPGMDGFELSARIRAMEQYKTTPIIFLTGSCSREYVAKALSCGAEGFILKPVNKETIIAKLTALI